MWFLKYANVFRFLDESTFLLVLFEGTVLAKINLNLYFRLFILIIF